MTKLTYPAVKTEQTAAERKRFLQTMVTYETNATGQVERRQSMINNTNQRIAELTEILEKQKAELVEVQTNCDAFVEKLNNVGNQDVITQAEVTALYNESFAVGKTSADRERETKERQAYKEMVDSYPSVNSIFTKRSR